jgi:uncharacterized NAD(P)/FAD-binding protein YdhS
LLNVPAGRLSADSQDPLQFLRFAQRTMPDTDAEDFLPRELYGNYLQEMLQQAERYALPQIRLTRIYGEVTSIVPRRGDAAYELSFANRDSMVADHVILAVGNPPSAVMPWAREVHDHPAYRADPWTRPRGLSPDQVVVIIGSGLTMADVALSLADDAERMPRLVGISRHGLLPLPQSRFHAATLPDDVTLALAGATSIRELTATIRRLAREMGELGGDWRELLTCVRNMAPRLWHLLPQAERQRFVRHLRCYWDVHRHRLPSQMSSRLDVLRRDGKLEVNAGRIVAIQENGHRLQVTWRSRGSELIRTVEADVVVNATGPEYSVARSPDPLLKSLHGAGLISQDDLALGLRTGPNGVCIAADGATSERLYYLGPMLRAGHWEATAALELRDHAERMARHLVAN